MDNNFLKQINWFFQKIEALDFEILVKGSASLYLNGDLKRIPNDIDILIDTNHSIFQIEEKWQKIRKLMGETIVISNNHFLKSFKVINEYGELKIEWITKNSIPHNFYSIKNGVKVLDSVWCTYAKILQAFHLIRMESKIGVQIKKEKIENTIKDINILLSTNIYTKLLNNINKIIGVDWINALFAYFSSSIISDTKIFLDFGIFSKIIGSYSNSFMLETLEKISSLCGAVTKESKNKLFIVEYLVNNKSYIMNILAFQENINNVKQIIKIYEHNTRKEKRALFKENILFFSNKEDIQFVLNNLWDKIQLDVFDFIPQINFLSINLFEKIEEFRNTQIFEIPIEFILEETAKLIWLNISLKEDYKLNNYS